MLTEGYLALTMLLAIGIISVIAFGNSCYQEARRQQRLDERHTHNR